MKIKNFINKSIILIQMFAVFMACARNQRLDQTQTEIKPVQDSFELLNVEPTDDWAEASRDAKPPLAEPISPETVAQYPHLEPQIGQILLGNSQVQVVLSGIPPVPSTDPWQPAVLQTFQKRDGRWEKFGGLGPMDLRLSNGRDHFTAIGLDTTITSHRASVTFVLAGKDSQGTKAKLVYHLAAHEPAMQMLFEDFLSSKNPSNRSWDWRLRFRPNAGQIHLIPERRGKPQWHRGVTHVLGDEVISMVGFGPLESGDPHEDEVIFAPPRGQAYKPGVEFFIGGDSAGRVPFKVVTTEACYQQLLKKGEVSHGPLIDCRLKARPGFLKLALFPEDSPIASYPRLIFFRDQDNRMVGVIPGVAGKDYQVFMSQQDIYRVIEINEQGEQRRAEFTLNENQVGKLTLAPRKPSQLRIELSSPTARLNVPAVMEIVNANEPRAIPVGKYAPQDATLESLSSYTLLVKKWPVSLLLPAAKYQVSVYRGSMGTICKKNISLAAVTRQQIDCRVDTQQEKEQLKNAITADFATQIAGQSPGMLADVLGVRMLSTDPFRAPDTQTHLGFLPILNVHDAMLGAHIRLFGMTPALVNAWRQYQEKAKGPLAKQVMAFAREQSPPLLTELSCPGTGINREDYVRLADQLKPDVVQVFGCGSNTHQERLLQQIGANLKKDRPPLLGAASFQQSYFRNFHFATWAFPTEKLSLTSKPLAPDEILRLIQKGEYSLSAGGYVAFLPLEKTPAKKPSKGPIQLQAKAEVLPGTTPTRVILWGENEILQEIKWDPAGGREQTVRFQLKTRPRRKWLRVELRGQDEALAKQGSEIVLATSNFMPIP